MKVAFSDDDLDRLETDGAFTAGRSGPLVKAFRAKVARIRAAVDERDLYALKSLHFEKLEGARRHQRSIRLNDQYRLILEIEGEADHKVVKIIAIEDYH